MPTMIMHRNHRLSTTAGHVVLFTKGEPIHVPKDVVVAALAVGAELVVEADREDVLPKETVVVAPVEGADRENAIFAAFKTLEERNERGDFSAAGVPNIAALIAVTGFKVDGNERTKLWGDYEQAKEDAK